MNSKIYKMTPWGKSQGHVIYGEGVVSYYTSGHGGFKVCPSQLKKMHPALRSLGSAGWFEEDCAWAAVALTFPHLFSEDNLVSAKRTLATFFPKEYEEFFARSLELKKEEM